MNKLLGHSFSLFGERTRIFFFLMEERLKTKEKSGSLQGLGPCIKTGSTANSSQGGCAPCPSRSPRSSHPGGLQIQQHTQAAQALALITPLPTQSLAQPHSSPRCLASTEYPSRHHSARSRGPPTFTVTPTTPFSPILPRGSQWPH